MFLLISWENNEFFQLTSENFSDRFSIGEMLTRVKSHLRATMGQQRLVNLALLSIENRLARMLNYDDIIKDFAQKKARKAAM